MKPVGAIANISLTRRRARRILAPPFLAGVWLLAASLAGGAGLPPPPPDLLLTASGAATAQAWQRAGWGFYLQLSARPPRSDDAATAPLAPGLRLGGPVVAQPFPGSVPEDAQTTPAPLEPPVAVVPPFLAHYLAALRLQPDSQSLLELTLGSLASGVRPATLIHELRHLAAANPTAGNLQGMLAALLAMDGQGGASVTILRRAVAGTEWTDPRLVRQLAESLWLLHRYPELFEVLDAAFRHPAPSRDLNLRTAAASYCRRALDVPAAARGGISDGKLHKLARRHVQAALDLAAGSEVEEADSGQVLALVRELQEQELHAKALELLDVLDQDDPELADQVDALRVESLLKQGRPDEAGKLLEALNRRIQAPPPAAANAGLDKTPVQSRHGYEALRRALAASMRREESANEQVGQLFLEMKRPEEAMAAFERALRVAPDDLRLRLMLGHLYAGLGKTDQAVAVLAPLPDRLPQKQLLLSRICLAQDKIPEAARHLGLAEEAAVKAGDQRFFDKGFYLYYASLCDRLGAPDRCLEQGEKALALDPDDAECANFVGYTLADLKRDLPRAEKLIRQAVAAEPDNAAYLDSLAWVCYRRGRFDDAWEAIRRVLDAWGDEKPDPIVLEHAGDIAVAKGLLIEAREYYAKALAAGAAKPAPIKEKLRKLPGAPTPKP